MASYFPNSYERSTPHPAPLYNRPPITPTATNSAIPSPPGIDIGSPSTYRSQAFPRISWMPAEIEAAVTMVNMPTIERERKEMIEAAHILIGMKDSNAANENKTNTASEDDHVFEHEHRNRFVRPCVETHRPFRHDRAEDEIRRIRKLSSSNSRSSRAEIAMAFAMDRPANFIGRTGYERRRSSVSSVSSASTDRTILADPDFWNDRDQSLPPNVPDFSMLSVPDDSVTRPDEGLARSFHQQMNGNKTRRVNPVPNQAANLLVPALDRNHPAPATNKKSAIIFSDPNAGEGESDDGVVDSGTVDGDSQQEDDEYFRAPKRMRFQHSPAPKFKRKSEAKKGGKRSKSQAPSRLRTDSGISISGTNNGAQLDRKGKGGGKIILRYKGRNAREGISGIMQQQPSQVVQGPPTNFTSNGEQNDNVWKGSSEIMPQQQPDQPTVLANLRFDGGDPRISRNAIIPKDQKRKPVPRKRFE